MSPITSPTHYHNGLTSSWPAIGYWPTIDTVLYTQSQSGLNIQSESGLNAQSESGLNAQSESGLNAYTESCFREILDTDTA